MLIALNGLCKAYCFEGEVEVNYSEERSYNHAINLCNFWVGKHYR